MQLPLSLDYHGTWVKIGTLEGKNSIVHIFTEKSKNFKNTKLPVQTQKKSTILFLPSRVLFLPHDRALPHTLKNTIYLFRCNRENFFDSRYHVHQYVPFFSTYLFPQTPLFHQSFRKQKFENELVHKYRE